MEGLITLKERWATCLTKLHQTGLYFRGGGMPIP